MPLTLISKSTSEKNNNNFIRGEEKEEIFWQAFRGYHLGERSTPRASEPKEQASRGNPLWKGKRSTGAFRRGEGVREPDKCVYTNTHQVLAADS